MAKLPKKLEQKLEKRRSNDALRVLTDFRDLIDFSSNDYLGLAQNHYLANATAELLRQKKVNSNGSSGSRLLTGNHILYKELEDFLSDYHNSETALVFNSGYDANVGFFSSVPHRGDIVFYDELIHASIRDGIQMSNAKSYKFKHNDLNDLTERIKMSSKGLPEDTDTEIYVVTESVFSMDGDSPDLESLAKFCNEKRCHLIVDEAHAVGIFGEGKGLICQLGLEKEVFARVITFGKALGSHGAAILGDDTLITYLVNFARSFIYTTALSPHSVASILTAYGHLKEHGEKERAKLLANKDFFEKQIRLLQLEGSFVKSEAAIHCLIVPGNKKVKQLSELLKMEGFNVKPILSPTVKEGEERLRFCLHSYNTKEEIERALQIVKSHI